MEQTGGLPVREQDVADELQRLHLARDHRHRGQAISRRSGRPSEDESRTFLGGGEIGERESDEDNLAGLHRRSYSASRGSSHSLNDASASFASALVSSRSAK